MCRICSKLVSGLRLNLYQLAYLCYFTTLPVSFPLLNLPTAYLVSYLLISSLFNLSIVSVVISSFSVHRIPPKRSSNASKVTDSSVNSLFSPAIYRYGIPWVLPSLSFTSLQKSLWFVSEPSSSSHLASPTGHSWLSTLFAPSLPLLPLKCPASGLSSMHFS